MMEDVMLIIIHDITKPEGMNVKWTRTNDVV